ncbi:hypothetical protein C8J57DRAFT_1709540 [Mycena rebaudengoi]|nr:hypothetical protein C8J57DRAFT_1709540 [Mycena rebaudengoi]
MSSVAELKMQGNALFSAKNFEEAGKKYTEAIAAGDEEADPKGMAVLYANRSACRMSLKRYMDARSDGLKATQLNPTYAKGLARLAAAEDALGSYFQSQTSWEKALGALPKSNLTAGELLQKEQYQAALKAAMAAVERMSTSIVLEQPISVQRDGPPPWELAEALLRNHRGRGRRYDVTSSAWVIYGAHEQFMAGVRTMNEQETIGDTFRSRLGAIVTLTNGLLHDVRAIHFPDGDFISKYDKQVISESATYRAWTDAGPEMVINAALARQRTEGWAAVRPALSVTIRAWIMRGVMEGGLRQRYDVAKEFFKRSLEVLRSLRESWILVPTQDRGVIFQKSFVFGVGHRYIDAIMQSFDRNPDTSVLQELYDECNLLIQEIDEALRPPGPQEDANDPGFIKAFYLYPRGSAYANKGYYYEQMAKRTPSESLQLYRKAGLAYVKAAECFPQDDEQHPWFLHCALRNMFASNSFPLRESLDVMKNIRISVPRAKRIWEHSPLASSGSWTTLEDVRTRERHLRSLVVEGKLTLDGIVGDTVD